MIPTTPLPTSYVEAWQLARAVEKLLAQPADVRAYVLDALSAEDLYVVGLYLEAAYGPTRPAHAL